VVWTDPDLFTWFGDVVRGRRQVGVAERGARSGMATWRLVKIGKGKKGFYLRIWASGLLIHEVFFFAVVYSVRFGVSS
jgi:hypothetical protein